mmetsp:Transcript_37646/g.63341  ORF Transcript_37646/g.63341 Transcript_37646/m.63341 type:complete len:207 (-) Transcript_37646:142-762(-)
MSLSSINWLIRLNACLTFSSSESASAYLSTALVTSVVFDSSLFFSWASKPTRRACVELCSLRVRCNSFCKSARVTRCSLASSSSSFRRASSFSFAACSSSFSDVNPLAHPNTCRRLPPSHVAQYCACTSNCGVEHCKLSTSTLWTSVDVRTALCRPRPAATTLRPTTPHISYARFLVRYTTFVGRGGYRTDILESIVLFGAEYGSK